MEFSAVRKISTTGPGKTYYLTIPKEMIKHLKWRKGEKKVLRVVKNEIVIKDWD